MEASVVAAWWGAIIASVVLLWDIFKWFSKGARILVSAAPNMQTVNPLKGKLDDEKMILVEVVNIGDLPTTITHLTIYQYSSFWDKLRNKRSNQGVIPMQGAGSELPHLLGSGARWVGRIDQSDVIDKFCKDKIFYCGVYHTFSKKPVASTVNLAKSVT